MASSSSSSGSSLGDQPNQPSSFSFPKRKLGEKHPVYRSFQPSWFWKYPWQHYDQVNDKAFCFTCLKASKIGNLKVCDAFLSRGYTNWKDASGDKRGGFSTHERSQVHQYCLEVICKPQKSVAELISSEHEKQKAVNRAYLRKVLENLIFLSRQGLPLRGNWESTDETGSGAEVQSNFHQLLLLRGKDDPNIIDIMQQKTRKYTDIQN